MAKKRGRQLGALDAGTRRALALVAGVGILAYLFWPKKAKAATLSRRAAEAQAELDELVRQPVVGGGMPGGDLETFRDPSTGVVIAGPSMGITPPPAGAQDGTKVLEKDESWSNLASRAYGDYRWWPYLWDYNRSSSTQFPDPDLLRRGTTVKIPAAPPGVATFKVAIFDRARLHREYWLCKAGPSGASCVMDFRVLERTPVPTQSVAGLGYHCAGC